MKFLWYVNSQAPSACFFLPRKEAIKRNFRASSKNNVKNTVWRLAIPSPLINLRVCSYIFFFFTCTFRVKWNVTKSFLSFMCWCNFCPKYLQRAKMLTQFFQFLKAGVPQMTFPRTYNAPSQIILVSIFLTVASNCSYCWECA